MDGSDSQPGIKKEVQPLLPKKVLQRQMEPKRSSTEKNGRSIDSDNEHCPEGEGSPYGRSPSEGREENTEVFLVEKNIKQD